MTEIELIKRKLERETKARKEAEAILEQKALELFHTNEKLRKLNESLEKRIVGRTKELERSEQKYRGIMENMELGLLEVDNNHIILRAYHKFCKMVGYEPAELIGKNAKNLFLPENYKIVMEEQDKHRKKGQTGVYEVQLKKKDKSLIWALISGAPIFDMEGNVVGSLGIHYDITERKLLEQDLAKAKKVAVDAWEAERHFIARMSHEIRTPLNAIIGSAHLLMDTPVNEEQKDYVNILTSSSDILQSLIADILDFSKIQAGEITVQKKTFDLIGVIKSLQKTFQFRQQKSNVKFNVNIDENIQNLFIGDSLMLNQILLNLLSNAFKFTKEGEVGLSCQLIEKKGKDCLFSFKVHDTGIGIEQKNLNIIFENFKQADNKISRQFGGTGLGLAITKQLIKLQGGEISLKSEFGKGSEFTFQISYQESDQVHENEPEHEILTITPALKSIKILVVEDNFMNQNYITTLFKKWSVQFQMADNGMAAIEMAKSKKYDLILMDISMPGMDGYEATIHIRNNLGLNIHTPIIALTASALLSKKEKAMDIGMTDYLSKPYKPKQLLKIINKYIGLQAKKETDQNSFKNIFLFSPNLDVAFLNDFYGEDIAYAIDMFNTFLNYMLPDFEKLSDLLALEDWKSSNEMAHKLKPSLAMVGLTDLSEKMLQLEEKAANDPNKSELQECYNSIAVSLKGYIPVLKQELHRMESVFEKQ